MKSVDALRELVKRDGLVLEGEEFDKYLDAIEEECRTRYGTGHNDGAALAFELAKIAYKDTDELYQFARRVEIAANDREDVTLFGVDYTPLPVDADGVPIHVGDVMEERSGHTFEVASLMAFGGSDNWLVLSDARNFSSFREPHDIRHHHAPTVEDVLREMLDALDVDVCLDPDKTITEYAAKLRLAGSE